MMRTAPLLACLVGLAACGLPAEPPRGTLTLEAPLLSADTEATWFSLGHTRDFQPFGDPGELKPTPRVAAATFRLIPEGDWLADFSGYGRLHFATPNPSTFPAWGWCLTERASLLVPITSGKRNLLLADAVTAPCAHAAVSRYLLESDYTAAPNDPSFGAPDGGNLAWLYLDDQGAGAALEVTVDTSVTPSPLGLFPTLPNTGAGQSWPAVSSWNGSTVALTADGEGDARVALVVKPGALPAAREVIVRNGAASQSYWVHVVGGGSNGCTAASCDDGLTCTTDRCNADGTCENLPNDSACSDGNVCTIDRCLAVTGCTSTVAPDGTVCGADRCVAGACVPGTPLDAVEPTGWASTEGGFNSNHSELRCGDDGRGGAGGYVLMPGLTFDLSSIPAAATIGSAELRVYQVRVDGNSPFTPLMREVVVEHVRFTNMWEVDEVTPISGTIDQRRVSNLADVGWRETPVTEAVLRERQSGRTGVQFRLTFVPQGSDGDTDIDWVVFASNNTPTVSQRPQLMLWYAP